MKPILILFTLLLTTGISFSQSDDPQAIFGNDRLQNVYNTEQSFLDNPLFTNINLTVNSLSQNEPSVRILRTNPNIVVAAWRDFRLGISPAVRRIGYAYSTNGGSSWSAPLLLPDPMPNHATQSDPVLTNDANGNIFLSSTSRDPSNTLGQTVVYRSTNNGVSFTELATAVASSSFEDKEWITCDLNPTSPYFNNLYITWTRSPGSIGIRFTKSTNGGLNWIAPVVVADSPIGQGSNIAIGTNFYVYVVWQTNVNSASGVSFDKSTNGGTSFGTDFALSTSGGQIGFPFICVDYSTHSSRGNVYVVWDDTRSGNNDVWFQRSTDAGTSWLGAPVRINDVTTNKQYKPAIQCDTSGVLHVVYYDERGAVGQVNSYYAYSTDGGNTWINQRLSDASFTLTSVNSDVRNGEYIGIDAFAGKIIPVWTDDRAGTPDQEIYTSNNLVVGTPVISSELPVIFSLSQNYPNPFNPVTQINYAVAKAGFITLSVYDVLGNRVKTLFDGTKLSGNYSVSFDASDLPSGVYFYTLIADGFRDTKRMVLIK